ncbi:regulator of nonsense transcripts 2-like isoform X2 [Mya arenaria]|uniref:regulator of nonsense transcripts 2-like isoform X1 n=1 Tax=Mya arenaria TaxID=6604 RepID=UPI0022E3E5C1|nr:regulator of nonsense transcripts 2-like isoform X1 [Mya arenaria]XP_052781373.1 regulator of nonsense transcripts 2-like isoform X2 [Mya arenaria]
MSGRAEDRRPARGGSESKGRGTRPSSGGGKSYRELRYQAGRGSGRGPRGGGPSDRDRHSDRDRQSDRDRPTSRDHRSSEKPVNELGDGDASKPKQAESSPTKTAKPVPSKVLSAAELEAQWQKEEEEKKQEELRKAQEEEERKRQAEEAERLRKEDEERRQEEERQRKEAEDRKCIEDFIADCKARNAEKLEQRKANLNADENRPEERFFGKLDSSLKKNTAFVKKLKLLSESQKESLTKEFNSLNLSKYIGEVAVSIVEAKLKMSDIGCAIHLCSILHQRYAEFVPALLENWQKCFPTKKDEKISNPSKYRVDLRFFAELVSVGVFRDKEGLPILSNQLAILINNDKEAHNNLSILSSFCKHCGDDYAGLLPRKFRLLAERFNLEVPKSTVLAKERKKGCRNLLKDYYTSLCKHLLADHKNLKNMEKQNRKTLLTKGELSQDRKERFEEMYNNYQKLFSNSLVFTDLLDEDMPDLPEDDMKDDDGGLDIFNPLNMEFQYDGDTSLWEDEETRTLYESLPDLKASIPGILYKESESAARDQKEADSGLEDEMENLEIEDVEREMETQKQLEEQAQSDPSGGGKEEGKEEEDSEQLLPPVVEDDEETGSLMKVQFEAYAQSLPTCVNRDLIDKAAIEFCMNFNTKNNRKKLVRALFTVHRTRYDLLPFYSRLVATLYPCMPDVANDLTQLIKGDFRWHVRKKDQINIESKLKTVRFIGELVKYKLFPKSETLHCLKMLLFDFSHHNIEMACALLEACGRFLYRSPESHHRTRVYLDVMMRKKSALMLDSRYTTMIENAYYYSNPPDAPQVARKVRPPMHEYIRKLLYKDLSKITTEKVLRQMRKLDWEDPEIGFYTTKCLIAVWNVRFNSIHCAANLLAGIAPYHETVAIQVVDGVLEDIRLGMEINHPKYNQRRVSCAKFLGELYNYRMVESAVIFKTLYSFITFGVASNEGEVSMLDSPDHLFRIRLVCVVLETCGTYFDKGSSKKKLDCFLVYFQRYYWFKKSLPVWSELRPFPVDAENLMQDTMDAVRPKLKMYASFEEASTACEELEKELKPKIAGLLPIVETEDPEASESEDASLSTIHETQEETSDVSLSEKTFEEEESEHSQSQGDLSTSQRNQHTGSEGEDGYGDEDEEEEEEETEMDTDHEMDNHDDEVILKSLPKRIECPEDDDFMAAFDKMIEDTSKARNNESIKVPQFDVPVPVNMKGSKKKFELTPEPMVDHNIKFTLITRRGNKQQFSDLNVPVTAEFATKFKERTEQERVEKERMKQVVLGIHERQEEEDYQEMLASMNRPLAINNNRERRVRYQHPKGAPDADEIFGSKAVIKR